MPHRSTHPVVAQTLDCILDRGAQHLYSRYIEQKLPGHVTQQVQAMVLGNLGAGYGRSGHQGVLREDAAEGLGVREGRLVMRVGAAGRVGEGGRGGRSAAAEGSEKEVMETTGFTNMKQSRNKIQYRESRFEALRKQQEPNWEIDEIRGAKIHSARAQRARHHALSHSQQEKVLKRRQIQQKLKELIIKGIPFIYEDDGSIQSPGKHSRPQHSARDQLKPQANVLRLNFRTIDVGSWRYDNRVVKDIVGSRKGFAQRDKDSVPKMSNEQYNNHDSRQYSTIPYLSLNEGVRLTERGKNITAEKSRGSSLGMRQYKDKTNGSFFKSHNGELAGLGLQSMSVDRPVTTSHIKRGGMERSLLWRPRQASRGDKVNISNMQLARKVISLDF